MATASCPSCSRSIHIQDAVKGRKFPCPGCKATLRCLPDATLELSTPSKPVPEETVSNQCPKCLELFDAPRSAVGTKIACPSCGDPVRVEPPVDIRDATPPPRLRMERPPEVQKPVEEEVVEPARAEEEETVSNQCTKCLEWFEAPRFAVGRKIACPSCGVPVRVEPPVDLKEATPRPPLRVVRRREVLKPIEKEVVEPAKVEGRSFASLLPGALLYPVDHLGGMAVVAILWAVVRYFPGCLSLILFLLIGGSIAGFMFGVFQAAAQGRDGTRIGYGGGGCLEYLLQMIRFFGSGLAAFAPFLAAIGYALVTDATLFENGGFLALLFLLILVGEFYHPMALMQIAYADSWFAGFRYVAGSRSIGRIPGDYLLCCVAFVVVVGLAFGIELILMSGLILPEPWGILVALFVASFLELYFWVFQMRVLGLLYYSNRHRLGWS